MASVKSIIIVPYNNNNTYVIWWGAEVQTHSTENGQFNAIVWTYINNFISGGISSTLGSHWPNDLRGNFSSCHDQPHSLHYRHWNHCQAEKRKRGKVWPDTFIEFGKSWAKMQSFQFMCLTFWTIFHSNDHSAHKQCRNSIFRPFMSWMAVGFDVRAHCWHTCAPGA